MYYVQVMGKYTVSKFYAIPRIDSLIECRYKLFAFYTN